MVIMTMLLHIKIRLEYLQAIQTLDNIFKWILHHWKNEAEISARYNRTSANYL